MCDTLPDVCCRKIADALTLGGRFGAKPALQEAAQLSPERAKPVLALLAEGKVGEAALSMLDSMPEIGIMDALEMSDRWKGRALEELKSSAGAVLADIS
jgi:hypothetical protein